jgi:ATP-dependent helicase HrpB
VVLATSIAETSLTIEGVRVVVDGGWMRVPRFAPRTGMTRLETVRVTRASADQRRGRAGRVGPGTCYRLWTEGDQAALVPHGVPEIMEADLAPLALELAAWGVRDPAELAWLDPPPAAAYSQARELLAQLGALDAAGAITAHGRRMGGMGLHPRLAHMVLRAAELGLGGLGVRAGGAPGQPRPLSRPRRRAPRCRRAPARGGAARRPRAGGCVERGPRRRAAHRRGGAAARARRRLPRGRREQRRRGDAPGAGLPDRIAQRRQGGGGRFLLRNGRGAAFAHPQPLAESSYVVAAELAGHGRESRIFLAAPVELAELEDHFADQVETEESVAWDAEAGAVRARRRERLGALVLRESHLADADPGRVTAALLEGVRERGLAALPWNKGARQLQERLVFLRRSDASWPDASDAGLVAGLEDWLAPHLHGVTSLAQLARLDLAAILEAMLPWDRRRRLDEQAPTHVEVPSGSRIAVDYSDPEAPVLAVRLQEVFGWTETPRIAGVPLTLHLLSPAHRPVQVTRDLASFWRTTYFDVKKDLKGRYPQALLARRSPRRDSPRAALAHADPLRAAVGRRTARGTPAAPRDGRSS